MGIISVEVKILFELNWCQDSGSGEHIYMNPYWIEIFLIYQPKLYVQQANVQMIFLLICYHKKATNVASLYESNAVWCWGRKKH